MPRHPDGRGLFFGIITFTQYNIRGPPNRRRYCFRTLAQYAPTAGQGATFPRQKTPENQLYVCTSSSTICSGTQTGGAFPPWPLSLLRRWHLLDRRSHRCAASAKATTNTNTTATTANPHTNTTFPGGMPDAIHHALQLQREVCSVLPRAVPTEPGGVE